MLRLIMPLFAMLSSQVLADDWCHSRFETVEGYTIAVDYQIQGRPNRAGYYVANPIWVNVSGAFDGQQNDLSMELTDVAAHQITARNQVLALNMLPADGGQRFTIDGKLRTSSNNSQKLRIRLGSSWLKNPVDGSDAFAFNMGSALWEMPSRCRFE